MAETPNRIGTARAAPPHGAPVGTVDLSSTVRRLRLMADGLRRGSRQWVRRIGLSALGVSAASRLFPAAGGRGLIFTLHHVRPALRRDFDPNGHLSVTPEFFAETVETVLARGLVPVALEDLPRLLDESADRRRFVCFTFDDGYRNNAEYALPVLRRHGIPATIFLTDGFVRRTSSMWWETVEALTRLDGAVAIDLGHGRETLPLRSDADRIAAFDRIADHLYHADEDEAVRAIDAAARARGIDPLAIVDNLVMSRDELRRLADDPLVRFGAHTLTHVNLRRVDDVRLRNELAGSADAVERFVGYRPGAFAYPYGYPAAVGEREMRAAEDAGYTVAVTTQPGMLECASLKERMGFRRVSLNGFYQKRRYVEALVSGLPFRLA